MNERNVIADLVITVCKMELLKYVVIVANSNNIEKMKTDLDGNEKKTIFVKAPLADDQIYIVKDEALKYSILSKIGIVKKCPEMERLMLSRLEQQILYGGGSERPKGILEAGGLNETEM